MPGKSTLFPVQYDFIIDKKRTEIKIACNLPRCLDCVLKLPTGILSDKIY